MTMFSPGGIKRDILYGCMHINAHAKRQREREREREREKERKRKRKKKRENRAKKYSVNWKANGRCRM